MCPHMKSGHGHERCTICDVVVYDRNSNTIQDAPFDDILVSSPRYRKLPESEIAGLVERFRVENQLIEADVKSGKLRSQKEYIDAQLAATSSGQTSDHVSMNCVRFKDNIESSLEELFPKLDLTTTIISTPHKDVSPRTLADELDGLNLVSSSSSNRAQIRVYVEPYGTSDFVGVFLDDSVRVIDVLRALAQHNRDYANSVLRWVEDDSDSRLAPDFDLPVIDEHQLVMTLGVNQVCLSSATADVGDADF